jgi:glucose dehydrogenase
VAAIRPGRPRRRHRRRGHRPGLVMAALIVALTAAACGSSATSSDATSSSSSAQPGPWDWPTYGHDAQHTFDGRTTLTTSSVKSLKTAWFFRTGDDVSATPTVVGDTVYVGSWDDYFYAIDLQTGQLRWKVRLAS